MSSFYGFALWCQADACVGYLYKPLAVEVAHGFLEHFLAYAEQCINLLGRTLVAERSLPAVHLQMPKQLRAEVLHTALARALQRKVQFTIGPDLADVAFHTVASAQSAEHLRVVEQSAIASIHNGLAPGRSSAR